MLESALRSPKACLTVAEMIQYICILVLYQNPLYILLKEGKAEDTYRPIPR
jgi:hypothetical protein